MVRVYPPLGPPIHGQWRRHDLLDKWAWKECHESLQRVLHTSMPFVGRLMLAVKERQIVHLNDFDLMPVQGFSRHSPIEYIPTMTNGLVDLYLPGLIGIAGERVWLDGWSFWMKRWIERDMRQVKRVKVGAETDVPADVLAYIDDPVAARAFYALGGK